MRVCMIGRTIAASAPRRLAVLAIAAGFLAGGCGGGVRTMCEPSAAIPARTWAA
jgi:hypothetical protein